MGVKTRIFIPCDSFDVLKIVGAINDFNKETMANCWIYVNEYYQCVEMPIDIYNEHRHLSIWFNKSDEYDKIYRGSHLSISLGANDNAKKYFGLLSHVLAEKYERDVYFNEEDTSDKAKIIKYKGKSKTEKAEKK